MFTTSLNKSKTTETILGYLEEPDVLGRDVTVIDVSHSSCNFHELVTDITPFYVKGGGQQSDTGFLLAGNKQYGISSVVYSAEGRVIHSFTADTSIGIQPGDTVKLVVDTARRKINSAIHTAGELVCAAVKVLGYNWSVVSAIHYSDNASVEFNVHLSDEEREQFLNQLQSQMDAMIQDGSEVKIYRLTDRKQVVELCGYFPDYVSADELIRVVKVWADVYGRPCAGTHLENINHLKKVVVTKVKNKKGLTQVRYQTII